MQTTEMGQTKAQTPEQFMAGWMSQTLLVVMRGILSCFPQFQLEKILILMAAVMGQQLGHIYGGPELSVYKLRKACIDAFKKGILETEVHALNEGPKEQQAASISTNG